jgi:hypothetical protein
MTADTAAILYFLFMAFLQPLVASFESIDSFRALPKSQSILRRFVMSSHGWTICVVHAIAFGYVLTGAKAPGLFPVLLFFLGVAFLIMVIGPLFNEGPNRQKLFRFLIIIGLPCTLYVIATAAEGLWL